MTALSICYLGNFRHDFCTEVHIARELEGLGHSVERMQEPSTPNNHARFLRHLEHWCRSYEPDLVMFTRTWGLPPETTQLWRRLEARGIVTCSFHLDLYVGLQREAGIDNDPFWTTQFVFTPDGDPKSAEFFAERGINHHWSPPAVVSDECVPGMWRDEYNYDVVFVGSYGYHDEWPWRPQLIDFLAERYGERFRRFGGDQPEGPTRGKDLNDLYASAKVVVGDSLCLPGHTNYFSDRYFETVGRGGFLVAPWVPGIEKFLTPGGGAENDDFHFEWYLHPGASVDHISPGAEPPDKSVDEVLEGLGQNIDYWIGRQDRARRIAANGQAHVARYHTYRNRLSRALAIMGFGGVVVDQPDLLIIDDPVKQWDEAAYLAMVQSYIKATPSVQGKFGSEGYEITGPSELVAKIRLLPTYERSPHPIQVGYTRVTEGDLISLLGFEPSALHGEIIGPVIDKLELGAGFHPTPGFTTLDLNPECHPDIVGPAWPLELPDESVGEIRAVDVLEHESWQNTAAILADWFRVLRPGGKLFVQVPDAALAIQWYCEGREDLLVDRTPVNAPQTSLGGLTWRLMGGHFDGVYAQQGQDWRYNAHAALFSEDSLRDALGAAGFVDIDMRVNGHPNLLTTCRRPA